jgi:hypothetical protein
VLPILAARELEKPSFCPCAINCCEIRFPPAISD